MSPLSPTADPERQPGDGVELTVTEARSAERQGLIRVLALSLAGAAVVIVLLWLVMSLGYTGHIAHPGA